MDNDHIIILVQPLLNVVCLFYAFKMTGDMNGFVQNEKNVVFLNKMKSMNFSYLWL